MPWILFVVALLVGALELWGNEFLGGYLNLLLVFALVTGIIRLIQDRRSDHSSIPSAHEKGALRRTL